MSETLVVYAVYYTSETDGHSVGYVWNNILVSSTSSVPVISGSGLISDPSRKYPIGSTYSATAT